ncbi:MAG: NAD(+)/NADH kinase [Geminicoccaceae bacterium]|nr:NAD(+)/NADH kinase [Geminicoccaceae bacterium]
MRTTFLHNPAKGVDRGLTRERLLAFADEAGLDAEWHHTKEEGLEAVLRRPADLVVVAGGDGTVGDVLTRLPEDAPPVLILPLGTANNVAHALGLGGEPEALIRDCRRLCPRPFDLGLIRGPWGERRFVEGIGLGLLARAAGDVNARSVASRDKIPTGRRRLADLLETVRPFAPDARLDGAPLPRDVLLVECLNIPFAGPALRLTGGDPGDGLFEVALAGPMLRGDLRAWIEGGAEVEAPLDVRRGRRLVLVWSGTHLHLDDHFFDPPPAPTRIEVEVLPGAVRVLAPPSQESPRCLSPKP